jgi:hypothetical protein
MLNNLGYKVTTRKIDWGEMSRRAWGSEWSAPDHGVYEFSNGRKFDSTDRGLTGIYGISGINYLMVGDGRYPDMPSNNYMLQENFYRIELG